MKKALLLFSILIGIVSTTNAMPFGLFKRARNYFKNNKTVDMCRQKTLIRIPDEPAKKISTHGLVGCTALALITTHESCEQRVTMSHYPPDCHHKQVGKLEQACAHLASDDPVQTNTLVVLVPEEWEHDSKGKRMWKLQNSDVSQIESLEDTAKVCPVVSPYEPEFGYHNKKHFPDFQVTLSPEGATWRSCGDGYITHKI